MIPFVSDELQKIYSKLLKMIVQRSIVGWSQWTQVTVSNWNEQRQPASDLVHQVAQGANFISIYSQRCKIRWSSKEECTEGLQFCHSINLTEAQRKVPIEFQFGKKCSLPGSFQNYPEEKRLFPSLESWNKLVWVSTYKCRRGRSVKRSVQISCWFRS